MNFQAFHAPVLGAGIHHHPNSESRPEVMLDPAHVPFTSYFRMTFLFSEVSLGLQEGTTAGNKLQTNMAQENTGWNYIETEHMEIL